MSLNQDHPESQSNRYQAILEAALKLSPSAIYDFRRAVQVDASAKPQPWWEIYPSGQIAAFVTRVLRAIGTDPALHGWHGIPWEESGRELPAP